MKNIQINFRGNLERLSLGLSLVISCAFSGASLAQTVAQTAPSVVEDFDATENIVLDRAGVGNEEVAYLPSGLGWGSYHAGSANSLAVSKNGALRFGGGSATKGSYAYTVFEGGDIVPAQEIVVDVNSSSDAEVRFMLLESPEAFQTKRLFRWIVSSPVALVQGRNVIDVEELWWDRLYIENEIDNLDELRDADETALTVYPLERGYGHIPINKLRGGGVYIESASGTVDIDRIEWTRLKSALDDTAINFQPAWIDADLDNNPSTHAKFPSVISPTERTYLLPGQTANKTTGFPGTSIARLTGGSKLDEPSLYGVVFPKEGKIIHQVYAEAGDYIVSLGIDNPANGTLVEISAKPVSGGSSNSISTTIDKTYEPKAGTSAHNPNRIILDPDTVGTIQLVDGYNYITFDLVSYSGSKDVILEFIELVKTTALPLVQAEAAEAEALRSDLRPSFGTYGVSVENIRNTVMPRFGDRVSTMQSIADFDVDSIMADINEMDVDFLNFRVLPGDFAGRV